MGQALAQGQGSSSLAVALDVPLADQALLQHRVSLLKQALPKFNQPVDSLELAITQMAAAFTQQTNDNHVARAEKELHDLSPKLPSSKFKNTPVILLDFLQVQDEATLPQI